MDRVGFGDEELDCPFTDAFIESEGSGEVMELTNFYFLDFDAVYGITEQSILAQFEGGRGRKSGSNLKDVLFTVISTLGMVETVFSMD